MSNDIKLNVVHENFKFQYKIDIQEIMACMWDFKFPNNKSNFEWKMFPNHFATTVGTIRLNASLFMVGEKLPVSWKVVCCFKLKDNQNCLINECEVTRTNTTNVLPWFEHEFQKSEARKKVLLEIQMSAEYEMQSTEYLSLQKLSETCSSLLESGAFSDVILCAAQDGTEFQVHRAILSSRSDVLSSKIKESLTELTGRIVIEDTASSTIKGMLNFIYSGKVNFENIDATFDLFEASNNYNLIPLKSLCAEHLVTVMDENNACKILLYAHNCKVGELKTAVLKYMCENKRFSDQKRLEILTKKNPRLLEEIILALNKA